MADIALASQRWQMIALWRAAERLHVTSRDIA